MLLKVVQTTSYRYGRAVALLPHRLLLRPRASDLQRLISSTISCDPAASLAWTQDVFGNAIATATFQSATTDLKIVSTSLVDQTATQWPVFMIAASAHSYPFAYDPADRLDLGALCEIRHDDPGGALKAWAQAFVVGPSTDTLSLLKDVSAGILNVVAYRVRDEEGTQHPLETLTKASGSCRDIAALFIEAVRHLGFGARAVTGYLYDPAALPGSATSTHAWAEVFLPEAGWIAFDPTHRQMGGANLIPVAVGHNNARIMPVTGSYLGAPDDFLSLEVDVQVTAEMAAGPHRLQGQ